MRKRITDNAIFGIAVGITVGGLVLMVAGLLASDATMVAAGAGLSATGGIFFVLGAFIKENENARSRFYLDEARRGLAAAKNMLADGNNDRRVWILAARTLAHTAKLADAISVEEHRVVYELDCDTSRPFFHDILKASNHECASFFMGSNIHSENLERAHARQEKEYEYMLIPEAALTTILAFARYPQSYQDPIGNRLNSEELKHIRIMFPSMFYYVQYVRKNIVISKIRISSANTLPGEDPEI